MTPVDDRAWECSMCDEYSAEIASTAKRAEESERLRALWFNENSAAQATLGRIRELVTGWEHAAESPIRDRCARDIRRVLGDMPLAGAQGVVAESCIACDYGYPASACSSNCDCSGCR